MCSPVHFEKQVKRNSLTSPFPQSSPPSTPTPKSSNNIILAVPLNCMEPKPEYGGSDPMETLPEMSDPQNTAVLAYPVQANSQSVYQRTMYPITLKVIISLSLSLSLKARTYIVCIIYSSNTVVA